MKCGLAQRDEQRDWTRINDRPQGVVARNTGNCSRGFVVSSPSGSGTDRKEGEETEKAFREEAL